MMKWISVAGFVFTLATACAPDATQAVVYFEADPGVEARAEEARIVVTSAEGEDTVSTYVFGPGADELRFPFFQPMHPRDDDASRRWSVSTELFEAGTIFARQVAQGTYQAGQRLDFVRRFSDACIDVLDCGPSGTCRDGECGPAWETTGPPVTAGALAATVDSFEVSSRDFVPIDDGELTIVPASAEEVWLVLVTARVSSSVQAINRGADLRVLVNDVEKAVGGAIYSEPFAAGPFQHFVIVTGSTLPQRVRTELRDRNGGTARVEDLHLVAFALPPEAQPVWVETDESITAPPGSSAVLQELTIVSESVERWVFIGAASVSESPGRADFFASWAIDGANLGGVQVPRPQYHALMSATVVELDASSTPATFAGRGSDPDGSTALHARMIAFRAAAFEEVISDLQGGAASVTGDVTLARAATTGIAEPRDHVVIELTQLRRSSDCAGGLSLQVGTGAVNFAHQTDTSALRIIYGNVMLLQTAAPFEARIDASSGGCGTFSTSWSSVVILRL